MRFQLPTRGQSLNLHIYLLSNRHNRVKLIGSKEDGTCYFNRWVEWSGKRKVDIGLPRTPSDLTVDVQGRDFDIEKINFTKKSKVFYLGYGKEREFIDFALWFSENANSLPTGEYKSKHGRFSLLYFPRIDGSPVRIEKNQHWVEVDKSIFVGWSLPIRVFTLFHEYSHIWKNLRPDNEEEADRNAIEMFKRAGFPKIEAVYAGTDILPDTDENYHRMLNVFKNVK